MRLTDEEVRHFRNVQWGTRFWRWFRWVLLAVLVWTAIAHLTGWKPLSRPDWLLAGAVYLLVAWPGLCRVYVFHTLRRLLADDAEARAQLEAAGVQLPLLGRPDRSGPP
jgi:hypothetical protein